MPAESPVARIHRRQFIVDTGPVAFAPGVRHIELGPGRVLSVDTSLRVCPLISRKREPCWLLGTAVDIRHGRIELAQSVDCLDGQDLPRAMAHWAGRWVLISASNVYPDATALLACHYTIDEHGTVRVSSSPVLLHEAMASVLPDPTWLPDPEATLRHISWFPPPQGHRPGMRRLLPTQILDLNHGTLAHRPLMIDRPTLSETAAGLKASTWERATETGRLNHATGTNGTNEPGQSHDFSHSQARIGQARTAPDDHALLELIAQGLMNTMRALSHLDTSRRPTLLLSGGRDSRLLLAMCRKAGLTVDTYTRIHRRASLADRRLPRRLASLAGYTWQYRRQRGEIHGRRKLIESHAGHAVARLSIEEFLDGGSDPLQGLSFAGFCAELGRENMLPDIPDAQVTANDIVRHFGESHPILEQAIDAWLNWRRRYPETALSLGDWFFLEQRVGGRKGAKEQVNDLFRCERIPPLNCAVLLSAVAHLSDELKRDASWIEHLVAYGLPDASDIPFNPPDDSYGWLRGKLLNPAAWQRLRSQVRQQGVVSAMARTLGLGTSRGR